MISRLSQCLIAAFAVATLGACGSATVDNNPVCTSCAVQTTTGGAFAPGSGGVISTTGGIIQPVTGGAIFTTGGIIQPVTGGVISTTGGIVQPATGGMVGSTGGVSATGGADLGNGQTLPPVSDYAAMGPFTAETILGTGPDGNYTMVKPTNVGENGFKHPILTWGNGITTTPDFYPTLLQTVASHGFVVIASNSSNVNSQLMTAGLDWLIAQNNPGGMFEGKLDVNRAISMGYSLGGQAATGAGAHPNVIATIAMHPANGSPGGLHGPLLLFSGTNDAVCVPASFVQPVYNSSPVGTFYAMLDGADHYEPVLTGGRELAPSIAWLRLWVYNDQNARDFFYGATCTLCQAPFITPQSKNLP